jgi:hypothetical protein
MVRGMVVAVAYVFFLGGPVFAQSDGQPVHSFEQLGTRLTIGEVIAVLDTSAGETRGRVAAFSGEALTLAIDGSRRRFAMADVARIERRRRDPIANGLLIGAGAGAVLGYGVGRGVDSPSCPHPGIECGQGATLGTVTGALWGAVGGWLVDTLIRKREVVYLKP